MKKVITIIIAVIGVSIILFGIAMGVKKYKENNALATADTVYNVSGEIGTLTIDESIAMQMLTQYSNEVLGISKPMTEYVMKLESATVFENEACLVKLFLTEESEVPEAVFAICGYDCFKFDAQKNEYLLLTKNGAFSVEVKTTDAESTTLFYNASNDSALHKIIDKFSKEDLGFQKEPSEYIMVATGVSVVASDKKTVYVVRMYEQDGTETNYTCAFNGDIVYKYDHIQKKYINIVE